MAFLNTLSKLGLVQLDEPTAKPKSSKATDVDLDKLLAEDLDVASPPKPEVAAGTSIINLSFEEIYKSAGVAPSPFAAEKLLRVMDGLKGMGPENRKAAVLAMASASDDWKIEGVVADAKAKIGAIKGADQGLKDEMTAAQTDAESKFAAQAKYLREATKTIKEQIAELEAQLQTETSTVAKEQENIQKRYNDICDKARAESLRFGKEVGRLSEIIAAFGAAEVKNG